MDSSTKITAAVFAAYLKCPTKAYLTARGENPPDTFLADTRGRISPGAGSVASLSYMAQFLRSKNSPSQGYSAGADQRDVTRFQQTFQRPGSIFGPGYPLVPPSRQPIRGWDYPVSWNTNFRPRSYEPIGFGELRSLAERHTLTSLAIETCKDQRWRSQRQATGIFPGEQSAGGSDERRGLRAGATPASRDRVGPIRYGVKATAAEVAKRLGAAGCRAWLDDRRFRVAILLVLGASGLTQSEPQ
jgi:hypothetical protein